MPVDNKSTKPDAGKTSVVISRPDPAIMVTAVMPALLSIIQTDRLQGIQTELEILQSLGGLYDGLAFYLLHWSYAPSL